MMASALDSPTVYFFQGYFQDNVGTTFSLAKEPTDRLLRRVSPMEIMKVIIGGIPKGQTRLAHICYVKLLGIVKNFRKILQGEDRNSYDLIITNVILFENATELAEQRDHYMVTEDDFAPTLAKIISRNINVYSFIRLREVCRQFDSEDGMKRHEAISAQKCVYFLERGIPADDARAFAFAIAFYTGSQSEMINRGVTMIVRLQEKNVIVEQKDEKIGEDASIIMFYLVRALSHLPFYWGTVTRCVELTEKELDDYEPGVLVTWLQFSSCMRGTSTPDAFNHRNTRFIIESLTGRRIKYFSNISDEDEVLLLPHSSFLVTKREFSQDMHLITMRQVGSQTLQFQLIYFLSLSDRTRTLQVFDPVGG